MPTLFSDIAKDYSSYKRPLLAQGFWAVLFHRVWAGTRWIKFPLSIPFRVLHVISIKFCEIFFGIYIGPGAQIGAPFVIEHFGSIIIHSSARIGNGVRLRQGVTIGNKSDERPNEVPTIGNFVDVGAGAKILGPITIGDNCVIGANAVVIADVPADCLAVGIPARNRPRRPLSTDPTAPAGPGRVR